ncbi:microtubule-destabilizing protein 60 [Mercurialis annua]|uniref:microtubule-destabilizing protein 60 n=1 Tax=Mercurialis annua TaxID=3986 RepID=UPI00215E7AC9|nr:microtubule-destabilizing protein 60 [Mercurialis annua]
MDSITKGSKSVTPVKVPHGFTKISENSNPNISHSSPNVAKSAIKTQKSASKNPVLNQNVAVHYSPRKKIRERKFVVAKKKNSKNDKVNSDSNSSATVDCNCKVRFGGNVTKCLCVAYETLRASQEEFFKNRDGLADEKDDKLDSEKGRAESDVEEEKEIEKGFMAQKDESDGTDNPCLSESEQSGELGVSTIKRRRDRLLEAARNSVPESGTGTVKHLVEAFERLKTISHPKESGEECEKKEMHWALPGLHHSDVPERHDSPSSLCASDLFLTSENLGLDPRLSWDSSRGSVSSVTSNGGRSRRNSSESCGTMGGRRWKKKQKKITSLKPFKLRTEQRGRMKEEEFMKKLQEMMIEQEKQRIPIAQGLPWTTDEPENLTKPPVKESTRPMDLKLHTDFRAVERAEFDNQVAEKMSFIEQYKMERERQQKLEEEEEVRRLRKELIPKAQPMPYFDRPFIPRRSMKHLTIPKDPKFHIPQSKKIKSCVSWNDMCTFTYEE